MEQPVYATIGSGVVNTAFTVVSVSCSLHLTRGFCVGLVGFVEVGSGECVMCYLRKCMQGGREEEIFPSWRC